MPVTLPKDTQGYAYVGEPNADDVVVVPSKAFGRTILSAGKKTDPDVTDRTITPASDFNHLWVKNYSTSELRLCIDALSTAGTNIIYVEPGEEFSGYYVGAVLHYSTASGTTAFKYVLS